MFILWCCACPMMLRTINSPEPAWVCLRRGKLFSPRSSQVDCVAWRRTPELATVEVTLKLCRFVLPPKLRFFRSAASPLRFGGRQPPPNWRSSLPVSALKRLNLWSLSIFTDKLFPFHSFESLHLASTIHPPFPVALLAYIFRYGKYLISSSNPQGIFKICEALYGGNLFRHLFVQTVNWKLCLATAQEKQ